MKGLIIKNVKNLMDRITIDQNILLGKPIIRGLRISVEQILKAFAAGISEDELLEEYPELEKEDFLAVFAYVAELVESEKVLPIRRSA